MLTCTASHLQVLGATPEQATALSAFALPTSFISALQAIAGFNWKGLIAFCEKYAGVVPALVVAFEGGSSTLLAFLITEASDVPTMIADFRAIFAAPAA